MHDADLCSGKHYINTAQCNTALHDLDQYSLILLFQVVSLHVPVYVCEDNRDGDTYNWTGSQRIRETEREGNETVYVWS